MICALEIQKFAFISKTLRNAILATGCMAVALNTTAGAQGAGRQTLAGHIPSAVAGSRAIRVMDRSQKLNLSIGLPLRNEAELDALLAQISDPASPNYRHYLTPEQFAEQFGPTESDYQAMINFAEENGLTVTQRHSNRMILNVTGSVGDVERAFHVQMTRFNHPTRGEYFSADREPSVDVDVHIAHVGGLSNFSVPQPMNLKVRPELKAFGSGSASGGALIGNDYRAAYAPNVTLTGAGQSVALLEFDGFFAGDVSKNFAAANLPPVPVNTILLNGIDGSARSNNVEVILDIMMAAYMAPGLSSVSVYEGYWPDDILNKIATDNKAQQISSSWSFDADSTTEQIFKQFQAQGQSFLQASGDSGGYTAGVYPPCDDPNITVVGATTLTTAGAAGPWSAESPWANSGGGVSTIYAIPSYQQNINLTAAVGSTTMRNIPDVAMVGAGQIYLIANNGGSMTVAGTSASAPLWAGFTALVNQQAVANSNPTVGFLNPAIYAIGTSGNYSQDFHDIRTGNNGAFKSIAGFDLVSGWGSPAGQPLIDDLVNASKGTFRLTASQSSLTLLQSGSASMTVDVASANGFKGAVGFEASGLPVGVSMASAVSGSTSTLTFTATSVASPGTYSVKLIATSGSYATSAPLTLTIPVPYFNLTSSAANLTALVGGTNVSSTITVVNQNNFNSSVNLAVSGLPAGMTATFSATSTKTTSTLTFKPSTSTVPGTYPITVAGTSPTFNASTSLNLVVPVPSFSLAPSASSLTLLVGGAAVRTTINICNPVGIYGPVALSLSGVPNGVTAVLGSPNATSSSSLTFTPTAAMVPGTYTVRVTGTSFNLTQSTTVTLVVPTPSFGLTSSVSNPTLLVGGANVSSTITIANPVGLAAKVALTVSGVPSGVTAVLSAPSTSTTSTLTFTPSPTAAPGTYSVVVNGTSATASCSTVLHVTIPVPSFNLTSSASALTMLVGGTSANSTITVANPAGLAAKVALTVSGVPTGVTAVFSAPTTSAISTLTFTPSAASVPGTYPVIVSGSSATACSSVVLYVTIPVPSFNLTLSVSTMSLVASGTKATSTITVGSPVGLAAKVALTVSGVPSGVLASLSASSTSSTSVLTLTPTSTAVSGNYTVTVSGISATASDSTTLQLTVK